MNLTDRFVCVCVVHMFTVPQSDLITDDFIFSFSIMIKQYKVMIMASCMTGFHIVGTTKSVCIYCNVCVCVCSCACVIAGSTLTADVLAAWVSLSHITHVCSPTWLQRSHPRKKERGGGKKGGGFETPDGMKRGSERRCKWLKTRREVKPEGLVDQRHWEPLGISKKDADMHQRLSCTILPRVHQTQTNSSLQISQSILF